MKEFVEKLIGRLEDLKASGNPYDSYWDEAMYRATELVNSTSNKTIDGVIEIVNQLAEEFDGEELRKSQKIYSFIKREINPYGKPFEGTVYEFGLKVMKFIKNIHTEEFATDINVVSNNGWIPCSRELPEEGVEVLVSFEYFRYGNYNRLYQTVGISYTYHGDWSGFVNGSSGWTQLRIIAWMPLPAPYKEGCE